MTDLPTPPARRHTRATTLGRLLAAVIAAGVLAACNGDSTPTDGLQAEGDDPVQEASEATP